MSVAVGVVAGFGAWVFRRLIGVVHDLFFLGRLSFDYSAIVHTPPGPWGPGIILVPVIGAIVVTFLIVRWAPEAKGHGVPEVIDAIYYNNAIIRPVVAVVKSLASALSIGTGGSVGREGPIIQISAAFASWVGRLFTVSHWQAVTLVAAGGGAGIAATFNTPIGGVLFAAEVLMHEISVRTLVPVALAAATATYVGHFFFGNSPAFPVPALEGVGGSASLVTLPAYVVLGGIMAFVSVVFIRGLYAFEDLFERLIPRHDYLRHAAGMLGVGLVIAGVMHWTGRYYVEGVGYATIMDVLQGTIPGISFLLLLFGLKLLVTCLTLGSGGSGGIFSPSLFMGTTLGAAFGIGLRAIFPGLHFDPTSLALAGMAGLVAGATGAALTAVVMIFEMTLDYTVVLPMTLTAAVAYGLRRLLFSQSIYTLKLARRGHPVPQALQANVNLVRHVSELRLASVRVLPAHTPVASVPRDESVDAPAYVVLARDGAISGVIARERLDATGREPGKGPTLAEAATSSGEPFVTASPDLTVFGLLAQMKREPASVAVVLKAGPHDVSGRVLGVTTLGQLAALIAEGMEPFAD